MYNGADSLNRASYGVKGPLWMILDIQHKSTLDTVEIFASLDQVSCFKALLKL